MAGQGAGTTRLAGNFECCTGCDAPFNAARKIRERFTHIFIATAGASAGRTGHVPIVLCSVCVGRLRAGARLFQLPAFPRHAEHLEQLVLANQQGPVQ